MGQKLVNIKFNAGSSPRLWDPNLNVNFKIETTSNNWATSSSVETYYPDLVTMSELPVNLGTAASLTSSTIQNLIKRNRVAAFLVDDSINGWRISFKEEFLTEGTWEILASGTFN